MKYTRLLIGVAATTLFASSAFAQAWPTKPLRIVVGFAPGGGGDIIARAFAGELDKALGQPVVVENRPGANGAIAVDLVAKSPPDGNTLALAISSTVTNSLLNKDLPYDLWKDLAPVVMFATTPLILVVHPDVPAKTAKEFIDLVKAKPGQLNYGSPGNGSPIQLFQELLSLRVGLDIKHIPYKGGAPAQTAVLANEVQASWVSPAQSLPLVQAGRLRPLAISTKQRSSALPDVPSMSETVPGYVADVWYGFLVRAGSPAAAINRLNAEVSRINKTPAMTERMTKLGNIQLYNTPAEFGAFMKEEADKWGELFKKVPIKAD
jgi:tripartite-type tricarboxylate transporter receptor subunit TctC